MGYHLSTWSRPASRRSARRFCPRNCGRGHHGLARCRSGKGTGHRYRTLREKRRALITRGVTRGLDPRATLRDSGIPWLGEIPADWEIKRLKYVGQAIIGLTFDPADTVTDGQGVLVLRASNVRDQQIVLDDNLFVLMDIPETLRTRRGDILICSRSGSRALIGKNALIDHTSAGLTFGAFMTVFRSPDNDYLFYIFNSSLFDYQAGAFSTSTINQLTVETLNGMEVPLPPAPEQKAIAARLRDRTSQLDRLVEAIERTITLLKERRAALIAAAVTGQIDVGGIGSYTDDATSRSEPERRSQG